MVLSSRIVCVAVYDDIGPKNVENLIAEDDPAMCEFLTHVLIRQGRTVKELFYGAEGMKTKGEYDLLLLDIRIPGIDDVSLARCVARDHLDLAIFL